MKVITFILVPALITIVIDGTGGQSPPPVDTCKPMAPYPDPVLIRSTWELVFNEDFNGASGSSVDPTVWQSKKTSAYDFSGPYEGGTRNPNFNLLDIIDPYRVYLDGNGWVVFDAWNVGPSEPYPPDTTKNFWATGLITTEWAQTGHPFKVRTGDYIETVFVFPSEVGAWPALWTWGVGNYGVTNPWGEVDTFEYHPNNPNTLELTSHVHNQAGDAKFFYNPYTIAPGLGVKVGTHYGENSITWYIGDCRANSTVAGQGVGKYFESYIIMNLAICAGMNSVHPGPSVAHIQFKADYIKVWRKNCNTDVVV